MWRHNPQTARFVELLPEIGELQTIRATFGFRLRGETNVRLMADLDGGALMDVGCYCISGARLLAGEPERVQGEQVTGPSGVDLRFTGTLRFPRDVVAEFTCSFTHDHQGLEAIGSEGSLFAGNPWHCRDGLIVVNGREERVRVGELLQAATRERERRDPRRGAAAARPRGRARPGAHDRSALRRSAGLEAEAHVREVPERRGRPERRQHRRHRPADDRQHPARVLRSWTKNSFTASTP